MYWWWSHLNFWDPYYAIISSLTVFSFPYCKTRLGFPRVHLPIVYLRYTLHVFYYIVNNMLALTIFLTLFSFCLNLFCLALCIWLERIRVQRGKVSCFRAKFLCFYTTLSNFFFWQSLYHTEMVKVQIVKLIVKTTLIPLRFLWTR